MDNRSNKIVMRHRDRLHQMPIYLRKMLRSFVFMSDWKMLPMSAVIAALVCMVVRKTYFLTMDGTLKGSFAFCCVSIWNGCFNSIQVICRERPIVKREHRSGMHISSYIIAHMIYQAMLCAAQTVITIGISSLCGVHFPSEGFITPFFKLDIGITLFLIAFASDMLSLLISAVAHSTTAAMTVMPFILIFQLVFSGGFFSLPSWAAPLTNISISNYGLCCLNAQANYNELPMTAAWTALQRMENTNIEGSVTVGEILDAASDENGLLKDVRKETIDLQKMMANLLTDEQLPDPETQETVDHPNSTLMDSYPESEEEETATEADIAPETAEETVDQTPAESASAESAPADGTAETQAEDSASTLTVGELIDMIAENDTIQQYRNLAIPYSVRVGDIIDYVGRDNLKTEIEKRSAASMADISYNRSLDNIVLLWMVLFGFSMLYALIGMVILEFIDKDKR